ncbi:MAG TPA: type 4a pilus biogenesis protein PilO [Candidatus Sulfomarinibacteraceae bacterium]|nr:type 4a pilus biogenesis protein PilO [Candidatus Sulfomarinibacteraceae bacterium]
MAIDLNEKPWWVALLVGLVLGVALFVVLQMYVFKPIEEDIQRTQDDIDQLEREIEKGRAAKADLPRLEEDIRNYELDLDRLRRILPTKRETDDLIKRLKHLMERGNFRLTRFVPGNIVEREFYLERPITVELDGTYHELGLFFDRMSGFSRIINVNDLVITPVRGQGGGGYSIHAAFTQRTFIYKE